MRAFTVGHGTRPIEELLEVLEDAGAWTLVDSRRYPASRRHPQSTSRRSPPLGGRRSEREWQNPLAGALAQPEPCVLVLHVCGEPVA